MFVLFIYSYYVAVDQLLMPSSLLQSGPIPLNLYMHIQ